MYNAVVTIEGGYEPYVEQPRAQAHASPEVAAVTAAYLVMSHYFPGTAETLAADYAASLADVPNGVGMVHGKRVGEAAAAAIIAERGDNGIDTTIKFTAEPAIGAWRPDTPAFQQMAVPWLGFATPFTLDSTTQISWPGPYPLTSDAYAKDFNEVKDYGASDSIVRSTAQTETALFWSAPPLVQHQARDERAGRRARAGHRGGGAGVRRDEHLGRRLPDDLLAREVRRTALAPITAIALAAEDGNAATEPDGDWNSLVPQPAVRRLPERPRLRTPAPPRAHWGTCSVRAPSTSTCPPPSP